MTRRQKLTKAERVSKQERNARRGRDSAAIRWTKQHVVQPKQNIFKGLDLSSRRKRNEQALADALKHTMPGVEEAKTRKV